MWFSQMNCAGYAYKFSHETQASVLSLTLIASAIATFHVELQLPVKISCARSRSQASRTIHPLCSDGITGFHSVVTQLLAV